MRTSLVVLALPIALIALSGCSGTSSFESELRAAVASEKSTLDLASFDSVDDGDFLVVCPYDTQKSIDDRLGFEWNDAPDYSQRDDRQTIALIRDGSVSNSAELSRADIDFCSADEWPALPTDAVLDLERTSEAVLVTRAE